MDRRLAESVDCAFVYDAESWGVGCRGGKLRSQALLSGLLIGDDASPRETQKLISGCRPDWIEKGIPSVWLGQISGSTSVAYAGVFGQLHQGAAARDAVQNRITALARGSKS